VTVVARSAPEHVIGWMQALSSGINPWEASMRRLEIDCTKPLEIEQNPESQHHFGIVLTLAGFAVAASVCSAMLSLVVLP
jgi:hypothetical protein